MIQRYKERGYQGFCLTNHFHQEFFIKTEQLSWKERAESFLMPWKKGKDLCRDDFYLGFGIEIRFLGNPNDYLLYGVIGRTFQGRRGDMDYHEFRILLPPLQGTVSDNPGPPKPSGQLQTGGSRTASWYGSFQHKPEAR